MQDHPPRPGVRGRTLLAIFAMALAVRILVLILHPPADDGDQTLYRVLARGLASGSGYVYGGVHETTVHPLLPVAAAWVVGAAFAGARWGWAGALVGLAYLNRPEAIFWLAGAGIAHLWTGVAGSS